MYNVQRFRIVTVEGLLSHDTFVIAAEHAAPAKTGCLVVINERNGAGDRASRPPGAFGARGSADSLSREPDGLPEMRARQGVVQDHVSCPYHGDIPCGLLEAQRARRQLTNPAAAHH